MAPKPRRDHPLIRRPSRMSMFQLGRFGVVGAANTALDFALLNTLVFAVGIPKLPANMVSVSIAMAVSYLLNRRFVFRSEEAHSLKKALLFFGATAFGLFGLQTAILWMFVHWVPVLGLIGHDLLALIGIDVSETVVILNTAKALATGATMLWNYLFYRYVIFKAPVEKEESLRQV